MVTGTIFDHKASKAAGGPTRVENAKIGLIQFCISPPKTDLENNVIISDYSQMDRYGSVVTKKVADGLLKDLNFSFSLIDPHQIMSYLNQIFW